MRGFRANSSINFINITLIRSRATRPFRPYTVIYTKDYSTRIEARVFEKYRKPGVGKEFLKSI